VCGALYDLKQPEVFQGPFQLKFPWGEVTCEEIVWSDVGLDVALLALDPSLTSSASQDLKELRTNVTPASGAAEGETWKAYGFPIANPTGMMIDGTIAHLSGTTAGTFPAIQLQSVPIKS
jgi:hypothetical protein